MSSQFQDQHTLAHAITAGPLDHPVAIIARLADVLDIEGNIGWVSALAADLRDRFGSRPRPTWREVVRYLKQHQGFLEACEKGFVDVMPGPHPQRMVPAAGAPSSWPVPTIRTLGELADFLRLHPDDLGWLLRPSKTWHYLHRWQPKRSSDRQRLIEIPKPLLKETQRTIAQRILGTIPAHEAAHGFRKGHSVRSYIEPHCGQKTVLRLDLTDFFPSIRAARVFRLFMSAGYPEEIARALTRLCTHQVPNAVLHDWLPPSCPSRRRLREPHLPQGAPSSPALANLCAFRLDCRLAGLAQKNQIKYSRYADDLLFSSHSIPKSFLDFVYRIIFEEGFVPNFRKTRTLKAAQRQHAAGVTMNHHPNLSRTEFDQLKATLHNCTRYGPSSQNRENHEHFRAHLEGTIAWHRFINPHRGEKLHALFQKIVWP